MKRVLALIALPTVLALALVRPAAAQEQVYDQVSLTGLASGVRTDGVVGASGGLVMLDTGSAYVAGTLDTAPSSHVLADPYEPGGLARTLVGQGNGAAGQAVLDVPDAESSYPGAQTSATCCSLPAVDQAPVAFGAAAASSTAGPTKATGSATGAALEIAGVLSSGPSTSAMTLTYDVTRGSVLQTAQTRVSKVTVAGVLTLNDLVANARITTSRDTHTAEQALTIGGSSVAGQPVEIGNDGVTAIGTPLLPGTTLAQATASANAALAGAGVSVHTLGGATARTARSASADTGGVEIAVATPDLPGGVAANRFVAVVGGVSLTELDTPFVPEVLATGPPVPAPAPTGGGPTTTTTVVPGTPAQQGIPPVAQGPGPSIAASSPDLLQTAVTVAGRRTSRQTAVVAFGGLQLLSLGSATLYALVDRRRRLLLGLIR